MRETVELVAALGFAAAVGYVSASLPFWLERRRWYKERR